MGFDEDDFNWRHNDWNHKWNDASDHKWDDDFHSSFDKEVRVITIIGGIIGAFVGFMFLFGIFLICFRICKGQTYGEYQRQRRFPTTIPPPPPLVNPSPVVVSTTTTAVPVPPTSGYPAQNTVIQGYPMPQPQPGYLPQPGIVYPNQAMPPYPMPQSQTDYNPPSYEQVVHGEAYQKQAPYNPNYAAQ